MHLNSFQNTELKLQTSQVGRRLPRSGRGGVDDSYAQREIVTEKFICYNPSISETTGIYI